MANNPDKMTDDEYQSWFAKLERPDQLAHARELRKNFVKHCSDEADAGGELIAMDDAIAFIELASHFELGTHVEDLTRVPALDAIEMMWDWVCDICDNDFRKAREMGIEVETTRRWSRMLNTLYLRAVEHDDEIRQQGKRTTRLWRVSRKHVREQDFKPATELSSTSIETLEPIGSERDSQGHN